MADDSEWLKLPPDEKVQHKVFYISSSVLETDLVKQLRSALTPPLSVLLHWIFLQTFVRCDKLLIWSSKDVQF